MNILVFPNSLAIGGSQLNAIELAGAVREKGHEVVVFGPAGPLVDVVRDLGLPYVPSPDLRRRPSSRVVRALKEVVVERSIEVLHGYEWPPALECYIAGTLLLGRPTVCTVMSMGVAPFIPRSVPLVVGTEEIRASTSRRLRAPVTLLEPPVDTVANAAGVDTTAFAARFGLDRGDLHVVVVSRLARELKLEGILEAIRVMPDLAARFPVRLVVVGAGPAGDEVAEAAREANEASGRRVVILTGEMVDPRPAYAVADVALGMGGSALKAMAFACPLVVQGGNGFWEELNPTTVGQFLQHGWYGKGDGRPGAAKLFDLLARLLADADRRRELGSYGRRLVEDRFSLDRAAITQVSVYREALSRDTSRTPLARDVIRSASGLVKYDVRRRWQRALGTAAADDFNASAPPKPAGGRAEPVGSDAAEGRRDAAVGLRNGGAGSS